MKNLESFKDFKLNNEELVNVNGSKMDTITRTGSGVLAYNGQHLSYTADTDFGDEHMQYENVNNIP